MGITHKTCLVTGCSEGGVGAALAEAFQKAGYHVFVTARTPSKVPARLHEASNVTILALDVASSESIATAAKIIRNQTEGRLDVLINNAGHGLNMPALDTSIEKAKELFNSNFFGVLEMIQVFSHMLIKARGVIVNNASLGGLSPIPFITIYNGSKAALITAGEGWRLELAPLGVRVITLVTGGVATKFLTNLEPLVLPEGSYYTSIKDMIEEHPEHIPFGMDPGTFALSVLRRVEKGYTGKYWVGGATCIARIAMLLFPQFALDQISLWPKPFTKKLAGEHGKRMTEERKKMA
ncbi:NAD(P)-binding protein [Ophiobolus disseminans]|uniref:NAD(P)-binding protein n=1 Tax=Ophiobolus disseminans TaxID=1469910 RepID=A0A6A7A6V2_9PLEO|nr:NAD(P)-binding protein [Ophiobolus disseminans]